MPASYTYPGVYVEEIPSGVRTIVGVSTSDTAFIDFFPRGPMNEAVEITSVDEFTRVFGGLHASSEASYAIEQYFLNLGQVAWVVRVASGSPAPASLILKGGSPLKELLKVEAANAGTWGNQVEVAVDWKTKDPNTLFNLVVREVVVRNGSRQVVASEIHRNLNPKESDALHYAPAVVNAASALVRLEALAALADRPEASGDTVTTPAVIQDPASPLFRALGQGTTSAGADGLPPDGAALKAGLAALDRIAPRTFNILCLPRTALLADTVAADVLTQATRSCEQHRAFLIVDIPVSVQTGDQMVAWIGANAGLRHRNAAVYFPRVDIADGLNDSRPRNVGASGTLAGVYARTDATRGVWKAPAGTDADLRGARLALNLNDAENGALNPLGINALRTFPVFGTVSWGGRTMDGADLRASEWKYIPVRRTALFIEESLYNGLKWVVFEPNDEPLWAQIRLNVGAFMQNLFRQGAFQGRTAREAYLVKCDRDTTTQDDINRGVVNILVGFAPLKPAEFVVIRIQQLAGQVGV